MRPALDKLRSVLVALTCDQHTSAALLRDALDDLEREDAASRFRPVLLDGCDCGGPDQCDPSSLDARTICRLGNASRGAA